MASVGSYREQQDRAYPGVGAVSARRSVVASEIVDEITEKTDLIL